MPTPTSDPRFLAGMLCRRACWWPTWKALALLILITVAAGTAALFGVYPFLALSEPAPSGPVVVIGWEGRTTLQVALEEQRKRGEPVLFVTGQQLDEPLAGEPAQTWAEITARELESMGAAPGSLRVIPGRERRDDAAYSCALALREAVLKDGAKPAALTLVVTGTGARRTRLLFQKAFGQALRIGVISVPSSSYDPHRWWQVSAGVRDVVGEVLDYSYERLFFREAPMGS